MQLAALETLHKTTKCCRKPLGFESEHAAMLVPGEANCEGLQCLTLVPATNPRRTNQKGGCHENYLRCVISKMCLYTLSNSYVLI